MSLPKWMDELRVAFSMAATDGMNLKDRQDYQLFQAISIAWAILEVSNYSIDPLTRIISKEAMHQIEELGK